VKSNDILLRSVLLAGVAGVSLWFFTAVFRTPAVLSRVSSGVSYPQVGVSLFWERNVVVVRVDDREERVPHSELSSSAIYQEAISRIPAGERPAETKIWWWRVLLRYWIPLIAFVWWVLFRLWQPRDHTWREHAWHKNAA
jgi:hypothetical protein